MYLAEAEGQTKQYLTMLGRLGRVEDVGKIAQTKMSTMEEAFALAQTLGFAEKVYVVNIESIRL